MSVKIGEYYYEITADNKVLLRELNKGKSSIETFAKAGAVAAGIVGTAFIAVQKAMQFVDASIREAIDAAKQTAILDNSLKNVGLRYSDVRKEIEKIAAENAFDDDAIKQVYNYGLAIGVPNDKLKQFAQTSVDYAAQSGKGLEFAMRTVGNAAKEGGDKFDKLSKATAGAGAEFADADKGISRLNVANKQLQESMGALILTAIEPFNNYMRSIVEYFGRWLKQIDEAQQKAAKLKILQENPGNIDELRKLNKLYEEQNKEIEKVLGSKAKEDALYQQNLEEIRLNTEAINKFAKQVETARGVVAQLPDQFELTKEQVAVLKSSMEEYGQVLNGTYIAGNQQSAIFGDTQDKIIESLELVSGLLGESPISKQFEKAAETALKLINNVNEVTKAIERAKIAGKALEISTEGLLGIFLTAVSILETVGNFFRDNVLKSEEMESIQFDIGKTIETYGYALEEISATLDKLNVQLANNRGLQENTADSLREQRDLLIDINEQNQKSIEANEKIIALKPNENLATITALSQDFLGTVRQATLEGNNSVLDVVRRYRQFFVSGEAPEETFKRVKKAIDDANTAEIANIKLTGEIAENSKEILELNRSILTIDNENLITTNEKRAQLAQTLGNQIDFAAAIQAEIDSYNEILAVTDDINDQLDIKIKIAQLELELNKGITAELNKQDDLTSSIIDNYIKAGLIDVQNLSQSSNAITALQNSGLQGNDLLSAINQFGLASTGQNIGNINIEVNEAAGETINNAVTGRLAAVFGG